MGNLGKFLLGFGGGVYNLLDDFGNVLQLGGYGLGLVGRILRQLAGGVEFAVLGVLFLLGELCVFGLELVALLLQLAELGTAGFEVLAICKVSE